jgi:hypothetical protein
LHMSNAGWTKGWCRHFKLESRNLSGIGTL